MTRCAGSLVLLGTLLAACAPEGGVGSEMVPPECGWSETTIEVPSDTVLGLEELVGYLADLYATPARWWDGAETEFFLELDTAAVPDLVPQTTYSYDPATSGSGASEEACAPFHYWAIPFPVLAAGTSDGFMSAAASQVEIVCADNEGNRKPPEDDLPEGLCVRRVEFELPVDVDPARVPAGASAPYSARVDADAPHEGAIIAHVFGAAGSGDGDTGDVPGGTAESPAGAILSTLAN